MHCPWPGTWQDAGWVHDDDHDDHDDDDAWWWWWWCLILEQELALLPMLMHCLGKRGHTSFLMHQVWEVPAFNHNLIPILCLVPPCVYRWWLIFRSSILRRPSFAYAETYCCATNMVNHVSSFSVHQHCKLCSTTCQVKSTQRALLTSCTCEHSLFDVCLQA